VKERDHLEDLGVDGIIIIILKWIFKKWDGGIGLVDAALDRDMRQTLVNAVMNLQFP
jgi:hypothetical protein